MEIKIKFYSFPSTAVLLPVFMYQTLSSAKEVINDLINILNNGIGKADISQSFWSMIKAMKVASYSGQAYGRPSIHSLPERSGKLKDNIGPALNISACGDLECS